MKKGKSFDNLLTDLHSDPLPDAAVPALSLQSDGVVELSPLSYDEAARLAACEQTIDEGLTTFLAVGSALIEIRQHKLYRASHRTFESYCRARFQLKRQRAYELMGAADVVNSLSEISDKNERRVLPERESHASALAQLSAEKRRQVWKQITDEAEQTQQPITATRIKVAIEQDQEGEQSAPAAGKESTASTSEPASQAHLVKQVSKAVKTATSQEIRIEVRGAWLMRHGLEEAWRQLRNRPEWVINEAFKDKLTLAEARLLGLFR